RALLSFPTRRSSDLGAALDAYLRVTGVLVVGTIVMLGRDGGHRFRTALGLDELTRRWVPEGRTTERLVVGWVVAVAIVASAIWLDRKSTRLNSSHVK